MNNSFKKFICKFLAKRHILASLSVDSVIIQKYIAKIYLNYSYVYFDNVSEAEKPYFTCSASSVFVSSMCCFC